MQYYIPQRKFWNLILRSSVSVENFMVIVLFIIISPFLSGDLRDVWMDYLEILSDDVLVHLAVRFRLALKKSFSVAKYTRFPFFHRIFCNRTFSESYRLWLEIFRVDRQTFGDWAWGPLLSVYKICIWIKRNVSLVSSLCPIFLSWIYLNFLNKYVINEFLSFWLSLKYSIPVVKYDQFPFFQKKFCPRVFSKYFYWQRLKIFRANRP